MTPSGLQEPSEPVVASQIFWGGPPVTSIFLILPSAANQRQRLSGDQSGGDGPSLPAKGWAVREFSGRTRIRVLPVLSVALKAMRRPSGDTRGRSIVVTSSGVGTSKRMVRGLTGARRTNAAAK